MQGAASGGGGSKNGLKLQTHMLDIDASPDPLARFNEVNRSKKQRRLQLQPVRVHVAALEGLRREDALLLPPGGPAAWPLCTTAHPLYIR